MWYHPVGMKSVPVLLVICACSLQASVITYSGFDAFTDIYTSSYPNADAAKAAFVGSLSGALEITFDNLNTTQATTIHPTPGVSVTFTNQENYTVRNNLSVNAGTANYGFDNTLRNDSGLFLGLDSLDTSLPVYAVFTFDTPVYGFGAYFTGAGTDRGGVTLQFNDGSTQTLTVAQANSNPPGVEFFGFTDYAVSFSSVTAQVGISGGGSFDIIGLDDVIVTATPEPATFGLFLAAGLLFTVRRKLA